MKTPSYQSVISIGSTLLIIVLSAMWARLYLNTMINIDVGWLLICVERFMAGGTYTNDFFETNPPLNFLIYLPAHLISSSFNTTPQISLILSFGAYIAIAAVAVFSLLRKTGLSTIHTSVAVSGLVLCETWGAGTSFAQRDHLVFVFLVPFLLYQYAHTQKLSISSAFHALCVIMGAVAIAIKPHYALIPFLFFLHRIKQDKSIKTTILSPDFWGVGILGVLYIAFIFAVTPDYFSTILPSITNLYTYEIPFPVIRQAVFLSLPAAAYIISFFISEEDDAIRKVIHICAALSIACFIPYVLQDKGFHYHILPSLSFGMLSVYLSVYAVALNYRDTQIIAPFAISIIFAVFTSSLTTGGDRSNLSNKQFLSTPLVESIQKNTWNGVYTSLGFKHKLQVLPLISDLQYGSRFQIFWTLNNLSDLWLAETDQNKKEKISKEMQEQINLAVADIQRFKPSVITIPRYRDPSIDKPSDKYLNFLLKNQPFKEIMDSYDFVENVEFNNELTIYNKSPSQIITHDIFVLKKQP